MTFSDFALLLPVIGIFAAAIAIAWMQHRGKMPRELRPGDLVRVVDGIGFVHGREFIGRVGRITRTPGTSGQPLYRVQFEMSFEARFLRREEVRS